MNIYAHGCVVKDIWCTFIKRSFSNATLSFVARRSSLVMGFMFLCNAVSE